MERLARFSVLVPFATLLSFAGPADTQGLWQTGKLVDSQQSRYFDKNTADTAKENSQFLIEGETYAYLVRERLGGKRSKPAKLTMDKPVRFALDEHREIFRGEDGKRYERQSHKLLVINDDGKEHEMEIVNKVLRPQDQSNPKQ